MLVKDQIRIRMEQLGVAVSDLARRLQISNQTVRHWLSGRNNPGKSHVAALEKALGPGWKIDFAGEYETPISTPPPVAMSPSPPIMRATDLPTRSVELHRRDAELFIMISQLQPELKQKIWDLVEVLCRQQGCAESPNESALGGVRHSSARPHVATR